MYKKEKIDSKNRIRDKSKAQMQANPCVNREGNYNNNGSSNPAENCNNNNVANRNNNIGFRVTLMQFRDNIFQGICVS